MWFACKLCQEPHFVVFFLISHEEIKTALKLSFYPLTVIY